MKILKKLPDNTYLVEWTQNDQQIHMILDVASVEKSLAAVESKYAIVLQQLEEQRDTLQDVLKVIDKCTLKETEITRPELKKLNLTSLHGLIRSRVSAGQITSEVRARVAERQRREAKANPKPKRVSARAKTPKKKTAKKK